MRDFLIEKRQSNRSVFSKDANAVIKAPCQVTPQSMFFRQIHSARRTTGESMFSPSALSAVLLIFPAGMALAATMDLLTMTIPNRLCAALAVGYFILAAILGVPMQGVLFNISCGAAVLILTFGLFSLGWIGGGDAKLAAATALWLGWSPLLDYSLSAAICGGALTLALLLGRSVGLPSWMTKRDWIARLHNPTSGVPYGIALAAAGIMIYPQTQVWQLLAAR